MNKMCIKTYAVGNEILVAACDAELLGKTLKGGGITFKVSKDFYGDIYGDKKTLEEHLQRATIANLVGRRCVGCGIKMGLILKENVLNIGDIPHAQFALMI
ncbi:MAG: DUF424 family protein [Candidatus Thermoplasmatota archaeon]|nr:DUF424 family protein [Candidatus Thermoplasmatota archaeon]